MNTETRHGTRMGYRDDRCKCDACKKAIALEHNVYKLRRAANGGRPLMVDKLGSVRRLQALMALGWSRRELARQAGYKGDAFALVLNSRRQRLTQSSAQRIGDLYERLCMTHGPSQRAHDLAAERGWPPPLAWDSIDDPDEQPTGIRTTDTRDLLAEWHDLRDAGESIEQAAVRLGVTVGAIERAEFRARRKVA